MLCGLEKKTKTRAGIIVIDLVKSALFKVDTWILKYPLKSSFNNY